MRWHPSVLLATAACLLALVRPLALASAPPQECGDEISLPTRYLLYSVNLGEGFNLVRDVFIRAVQLLKLLNSKGTERWVLVLPKWSNPHWREGRRRFYPWSDFFDVASMQHALGEEFMELEEFIAQQRGGTGDTRPVVDDLIHLHLDFGPSEGGYKSHVTSAECDFGSYPGGQYRQDEIDGTWRGTFWGHGDTMSAARLSCYGVLGDVSNIEDTVRRAAGTAVMIARIEHLLHIQFAGPQYWRIRNSMVFASVLTEAAERFAQRALGDRYLAVHMRRADFLYAHPKDIPPVVDTVAQISTVLERRSLTKVFLATDARADDDEFQQLFDAGLDIVRYEVPSDTEFSEGQMAIIDQWICINSEYFIGTRESTFSMRINEERELRGVDPALTFNVLCPAQGGCEPPQRWPVTGIDTINEP